MIKETKNICTQFVCSCSLMLVIYSYSYIHNILVNRFIRSAGSLVSARTLTYLRPTNLTYYNVYTTRANCIMKINIYLYNNNFNARCADKYVTIL